MTTLFGDIGSYVFGDLAGDDLGHLALTIDEMAERQLPHAHVLRWENGRLSHVGALPWHVKALLPVGPDAVLAVGEHGQDAVITAGGGVRRGRIAAARSGPASRGPLRRGAVIGGFPLVVGMDRQVYRWNKTGSWDALEEGFPASNSDVVGFEAVAGFSFNEIYCAGWHGEIWQYNGSRWRQIDSPTSNLIVNLCCGDDGLVYACGRQGLLLRGRKDSWSIVEHGADKEDFWGIAWYRNRLYLSSMKGLSAYDGAELVPVELGDHDVRTFFHLSASRNTLWTVGAKDVLVHDGTGWSRIVQPSP